MTREALQLILCLVPAFSWPVLWLVALTRAKDEPPPPVFCWLFDLWDAVFGESNTSDLAFGTVFGIGALALPMVALAHVSYTLAFLLLP